MADATTRILHNTTDQAVYIREIPAEIRAHDQVSVTTKYHQPVVLENYPGVVDVTDMTPEEQRAFHDQERDAMDKHAAPRVEALKQTDDKLNAAEAEARGVEAPAPVPRFNADGTPAGTQAAAPAENQTQQGAQS